MLVWAYFSDVRLRHRAHLVFCAACSFEAKCPQTRTQRPHKFDPCAVHTSRLQNFCTFTRCHVLVCGASGRHGEGLRFTGETQWQPPHCNSGCTMKCKLPKRPWSMCIDCMQWEALGPCSGLAGGDLGPWQQVLAPTLAWSTERLALPTSLWQCWGTPHPHQQYNLDQSPSS